MATSPALPDETVVPEALRDLPPAFIEMSASEFGARPGLALAEVAAGAVVRITDRRMGVVKGYLMSELPPGLEPVEHLLPPPSYVTRPRAAGSRTCPGCGQVRPAEDFAPVDRANGNRRQGRCNACASAHRERNGAPEAAKEAS